MKNSVYKKWIIALIPTTIVFFADISSKVFLINLMTGRKLLEVCDFFNIVNVYNRGISFSMFSDGGTVTKFILYGISTAISLFIIFWIKKETSRFTVFCLGIILGGALGNLVDRICNGAVFDFLDFHVGKYHWPAFNVADAAIVSGFLVLSLSLCVNHFILKKGNSV